MKTVTVPESYQHTSPAGAEIRILINLTGGGVVHCTLKEKKISKAVRHQTVSEVWFILSGKGAIWRKNGHDENITMLEKGVSIDIPLGTDFQYRSDVGNLVFLCVTMPPWTGFDEVVFLEKGAWQATI